MIFSVIQRMYQQEYLVLTQWAKSPKKTVWRSAFY